MQALAIVLLAFIGILWMLRLFARTPPKKLKALVQKLAGAAALGVGGLLLVRGRWDIGTALSGLGLWMLGMGVQPEWTKAFKKGGATPGLSRVRSAMIEMELDHASGAISGSVLAGVHEGQRLAQLSREQCDELYRVCLASDPDGARLLEAYLDRRFPGWRPAGDQRSDAGAGQRSVRNTAAMSEDEAYEILGLHKGATRDEVSRAHRSLMKKLHPDHGGSTNLAARVNEAKEVLLRRTH